jgi:hypothetical protein
MNKNDLAQYNHSNIQELIRFIDQKAGALLVIYGFILTALVEYSKNLNFINPFKLLKFTDIFNSIFLFLIGAWILFLMLYQIYIVIFKIIRPRRATNYTQEEISTIYFHHISNSKKEEFTKLYSELPDDRVQKELLDQIYEISCILSQKSENFNSILKWLYTSIISMLLFIFLCKMI